MTRRARKVFRVGVYWDPRFAFGRETLLGISSYAREHGSWRIFSSDTFYARRLPPLNRWNGDGVVGRIGTRKRIAGVLRLGLPAVSTSDGPKEIPFPRVIVDSRAVGRRAADHLLDMGFQHFAAISTPDWYSQQSSAGFCRRVTEAGFECPTSCISRHRMRWYGIRHARPNPLGEWLKQLKKPTGLMVPDDFLGSSTVRALMAAGFRIPGDIALISAGNDELVCECAGVPLSSVAVPHRRIAYAAAAMLDRIMRGKKPPKRPVLVPPGEVVHRDSSALSADSDPDIAAAISFIHERAYGPLRVDDVLEQTRVSRKTLETRFREILGRGPYAEIRRLRIERAKRLLRETALPLSRIASMGGFSDARHLSVVFRRELDTTPTEFRLSHQDAGL